MKFNTTFLATLLLSSGASACASYKRCHCANEKGEQNDGVTELACTNFQKTYWPAKTTPGVKEGVNFDGINCSVHFGDRECKYFNNCKFAKMCADTNTGFSKSACYEKVNVCIS